MTKEEYKNKICRHCINEGINCLKLEEIVKDNLVISRCANYRHIFSCGQTNCNECKNKICEVDHEHSNIL